MDNTLKNTQKTFCLAWKAMLGQQQQQFSYLIFLISHLFDCHVLLVSKLTYDLTSLTSSVTALWPPPEPQRLSMRRPPMLILSSTAARSSAALEKERQHLSELMTLVPS